MQFCKYRKNNCFNTGVQELIFTNMTEYNIVRLTRRREMGLQGHLGQVSCHVVDLVLSIDVNYFAGKLVIV